MIRKLRIKFICINMLIVTIMLSFILSFVVFSTKSRIEQDSMNMMRTVGAEPVRPGRPEGDRNVRLPFFSLEYDDSGELRARGGYYDLSDTETLEEIYAAADASEAETGKLADYNLRYMKQHTPRGDSIVFADMSSENNALKSIVKSCIVIGIAAFLAFLLVSVLLARWAIKPVEAAWNDQKKFVADASHDLKTPLTVIMTNADMLPPSPQKDGISKMASQMRGLIDNLLELARVDSAKKESFDRLDFSELISTAVLPYEPIFYENGKSLAESTDKGIFINGNRDQLERVLAVLLDNACKYSLSGTETEVRLESGQKNCLLSVESRGDPISDEDLKNIFKRFYRAEESRTMNRSYGLGLSIAEGIVENHGGSIWAESENGVNTFFVRLPCA